MLWPQEPNSVGQGRGLKTDSRTHRVNPLKEADTPFNAKEAEENKGPGFQCVPLLASRPSRP